MHSTTTPSLLLALAAYSTICLSAPTGTSSSSSAPTGYGLVADYSGSSFFNNFQTFTGADPTHGYVNYTDMQFAGEQGYLGYIRNETSNSTNAYIGVDYKTQNPSARNSVRIMSTQTFEVGMVTAIDVAHAPVGYGLWPAIWLLANKPGVNWPQGGEQDLVEWVHDTPYNSMTLHTGQGCSVQNTSSAFQGNLRSTDCNAGQGSDGCSIAAYHQDDARSQTLATAGQAFNDQGGAMYVHEWTTEGVTIWMFARDAVPSDLAAGKPNPSSWTQKPLAKFSGTGCDYSTALASMQLIINIDFCGDWAGKVWQSSGAANATKAANCNQYVAQNANAFKDAYFEIGSIKIYSSGALPQKAASTKRDAPHKFKIVDLSERNSGSANSSLNAKIAGHRIQSTAQASSVTPGSDDSESGNGNLQIAGDVGGHRASADVNISGVLSSRGGSVEIDGGVSKRDDLTMAHAHHHNRIYMHTHLHRTPIGDSAQASNV